MEEEEVEEGEEKSESVAAATSVGAPLFLETRKIRGVCSLVS